ncbi:MAG: ParB N-terminal domain-containing protein [Planctomycetota bacterium]
MGEFSWEYRQLGDFTYNVLPEGQVKPFLLRWLKQEWERDHVEFPDQLWTVEWLEILPRMDFTLELLPLRQIRPRRDLVDYSIPGYSFAAELESRADELEESMLRGVSIEPLVVNREGLELMDGHTRYAVLARHSQKEAYAYVGAVVD